MDEHCINKVLVYIQGVESQVTVVGPGSNIAYISALFPYFLILIDQYLFWSRFFSNYLEMLREVFSENTPIFKICIGD